MSNQKLIKKCKELDYSKSYILTDSIIESTISSLKILFSTYEYSNVFGALAKIWPQEKAIPFFNKASYKMPTRDNIKTIATHYHRAYNGGIERVQAQLMTIWVRMGYNVILFTEEPENPLDFPYPSSVKRIIIPTPSNLNHRLDTIQKYAQEEHIDIFVNHCWENPSVLWECMLLKMLNIPYIQYLHAHFAWSIADAKKYLYQPELFKLCNIVLSLSETNARFYQLCGCNSFLVQNPIPEDLTNNMSLSELSSNHILMIGRLSPEKRPMDAIQIFKLVHDQYPNIILDIVGGDDGNFISQMQEYIHANKLTNSVIFHGRKTATEIAEFYRNSLCVLFTSEMEGYPMVVLESKCFGLPLVMYELPYLALTKDGKGILTAPIGNLKKMSEHIIRLLSDITFRKNLGTDAKESFDTLSSYSLENTWQTIISICSSNDSSIESSAYFNPNNIPFADQFIEPMLLDAVKKGFDNVLESNLDYQVGKKILKFPRFCRNALLNIIRRTFNE